MADFNKRFVSNKQEWVTPDILYCPLQKEFCFQIDLAADQNNTKCSVYFDQQLNSLNQIWNGICWLNPPYGNTKYKLVDWVKKADKESNKDNCIIVMLIPARTNTKWWHEYCMNAAEIRFICGRPKFGNADYGLPLPLAVVIFKKHNGSTIYSSLFL